MEDACATGSELNLDVVDSKRDRQDTHRLAPTNCERFASEPEVQRMPPIPHANIETFEFFRKSRVELQDVARDLDTCRDALDEVDCTCHGAEVYTLRCCALLDVSNVALQRLGKVHHGARAIRSG